MHYANGQEAKAGDLVYKPAGAKYPDIETIGILVSASAGTSCNGSMRVMLCRYSSGIGKTTWMATPTTSGDWCVTLSELWPVERKDPPAGDPSDTPIIIAD